MRILRVITLTIVLLAAFILGALAWTSTGDQVTYSAPTTATSALLDAAESNYTVNASNSDNVYQQQVVAQWGIKDLVEITALQNGDIMTGQQALLSAQADLVTSQRETNALLRITIAAIVLLIVAVTIVGAVLLDNQWRRRRDSNPAPAINGGAL